MSEGPIKRWRNAWQPAKVTTPPTTAVHAANGARTYCGRKNVPVGEKVTCSDCLAALRSDTEVGGSRK